MNLTAYLHAYYGTKHPTNIAANMLVCRPVYDLTALLWNVTKLGRRMVELQKP